MKRSPEQVATVHLNDEVQRTTCSNPDCPFRKANVQGSAADAKKFPPLSPAPVSDDQVDQWIDGLA